MSPRDPSTRGGWRVALRLARREALRRKGQTALMLVLICLPVLAVSAAAIVWRTADVSSAEGIDRRMGSAAALVETTGMEHVFQTFDPENGGYGGDGGGRNGRKALGADDLPAVLAVLGADRLAIPLARDTLAFETDQGVGDLETLATDLASPLADGLLEPIEGQYPPGPGEVVVSQALADRGPGIGETLTVIRKTPDGERAFELAVVGIAESTASRGYELAAGLTGAFGTGDDPTGRWLVGGGPVSWDDVRAVNAVGVLATSRAVLRDPPAVGPSDPNTSANDEPVDDVVITVLALIGVMVLLEVVLLAGPAFAVRAKAQAHTLALVAAAGGTPRQARRTVLASGVVIGAIGGVLGVGLGVMTGALAVPIAQRFDQSRFGPFEVPWVLLLLVAGFGLLSAVLAAVVPAVSASRQDVVAVLAGRRGEGRASVRSPLLGVALLAAGIVGSVVGAGAGQVGAVLIAGSALLSVIGMILLVPIAVSLVALLAGRLPLALRFAARDAVRHRTRTVPAVAAVGATVAGVVALGIAVSSQETANEADYMPQLPIGQASVSFGSSAERDAVEAALARFLPEARVEEVRGIQTTTPEGTYELEFRVGGEAAMLDYWSSIGSPYLVGTEVPGFIEMSAAERERAGDVLADGGVVLLRGSGAEQPQSTDRVRVDLRRYDPEEGDPEDVTTQTAPATTVTVAQRYPPAPVVMSPEAARQIGLEPETVGLLVSGEISPEAAKDVQESLSGLASQPYFYVERGYQSDDAVRIIQFVLAALGAVLMLGGTLTATFLALSDARPDLATMAAVGARPRTRRRVAASYALVVGGIGALLGAPVGFIPGLAISQPLTRDFQTGATALDVPWLLIGAVVVGLPLLTAAAVGACARGRLPLTARVD